MHTAFSPVEDDVFASSTQSARKRKSERMAMDEGEAPAAPRKTMKKPNISGSAPSAKDKAKHKPARTSGPSSSRKMPSSTDLHGDASGSGQQPAVKQEKSNSNIFRKRDGTPLSVFVVDGLFGGKRQRILTAVKANGGALLGAGRIEDADLCVFDRSTSKDFKTIYAMAVNAELSMVNADFVPSCIEAGRLLRYDDFPVPESAKPTTEAKRVGRPSNSFFADENSRKNRKDDFLDDDEDDSDDESSDEEPAPRKKMRASTSDKSSAASPRAKGRTSAGNAASSSSTRKTTKVSTTVKSAKEQSAVKEPKLIRNPKITSQAAPKPAVAKSVPKPAVPTSAERDSPNPPPPEQFDGKRYKFTDEEMEWAWAKVARMAQQDEYLTLAKASEGLAKKTPHHSASSWRGKLERDQDKFDEIRADANPSKAARPAVSSPNSGMPPKLRVNSSGSSTGQANECTTNAAAAQPMQVDEPAPPSHPDIAPTNEEECTTVQPGEEDDFERAVSFLTSYDPPAQVEYPGDESIWPVLNRTLAPCKSRPSWQEFWEKYENSILQGVENRVNARSQTVAPQSDTV